MRTQASAEICRLMRHEMPESLARYVRPAGGPTRAGAGVPRLGTHGFRHHQIPDLQED